jgi:hypothetical protein
VDHHALGDRRGAGGRRAVAALDLDQAQRQEPKASTMSVAQSFGTWMPASIEARITEVPSGTSTSKPSMVSRDGLFRPSKPGCRNQFP